MLRRRLRERRLHEAGGGDDRSTVGFDTLYDVVFRETFNFIYSLCFGILRHPEAAADAASAAFEKMLIASKKAEIREPKAWLRVAASHAAIDLLRAMRPHMPLDLIEEAEKAATSPDESFISDSMLDEWLSILPPDQRIVVELWLQGYSGIEIAEGLARTPNWVYQSRFQAFRRLEKLLSAGGEDAGR